MPTLYAVVPLYNESATLHECLARVVAVALPSRWTLRILVVDDGSDEATRAALMNAKARLHNAVTTMRHERNRGKGAAVATGFGHVAGVSTDTEDAVIIQDADLEYDPADFLGLIHALEAIGPRGAAFGNRWHRGAVRAGLKGRLHMGINRLLTKWSNARCGIRLSDMECCYKAMRVGVMREVLPLLSERGFGIEPELVAALARLRVPFREVPVSYSPRTRAEGKKIGPLDGIRALWVTFRGVSPRSDPRDPQ